MGAKNGDDPDGRPRTIPIFGDEYEWWSAAVRRQLRIIGIDQKDLAARLDVSPALVSRCINRKVPTFELLIAISDELKVAYPVILPESEEEATRLAQERRLIRRDLEATKIKAGVPEIADEDQPPGVISEHAVRSRKEKGTQGSRARVRSR